MKLYLPIAKVVAVTNLMLNHGSGEEATLVPAKSITFRAEVEPKLLEEFRAGLADRFFDPVASKEPRVPAIPELEGPIGWKTEYESGTLRLDLRDLDDLDFEDEELLLHGVNAKGITFEPLATGMVDLKVNAIVETDDAELRGKVDALLKHTLKATFSKLTQKPLMEPEGPQDGANPNQGQLPIDGATATTDGQPITPLVH
jgi:hypothetical protein